MTTFFEYVLTRCHGQPLRSHGRGVSYFECPVCGHESFHTMPDLPGLPHRARCYGGCEGRWKHGHRFPGGDVFDVLAEIFPWEDYGDRRDRHDALLAEWRAQAETQKPDTWRGATKVRMTPAEFMQRKRIQQALRSLRKRRKK